MAKTAATPRRRPPDAAYKIINPILGLILRSPLSGPIGKRLLLLEFVGRKSGKHFRTPVGYVRDGDALLMATQSRWKANLRGGVRVAAWLGGKRRTGTATLIEEPAGLADTLERIVRAEPQFGEIIGASLDPDGRLPEADLARMREQGFAGIRLVLD